MNNEYKKGFLEAIDGVLDIINDAGQEIDKDSKSFKYELKNLENEVLGLKIAFFETYNGVDDNQYAKIEENQLPKQIDLTLPTDLTLNRFEVKMHDSPYPTK